MRRDDERLQDILDAIAAIERYLQSEQPTFETEELIQRWVTYHLHRFGWQVVVNLDRKMIHGHFFGIAA